MEKPVENVEKCGLDMVFFRVCTIFQSVGSLYRRLHNLCEGRVMLPFYKSVFTTNFAEKVDNSSKWAGSCPCVQAAHT